MLLEQLLPEAVHGDAPKVLIDGGEQADDFDLGLLSHVCEKQPEELLALLDDSLANGTLTSSAKLPGGFAFDHDLIREALLADVPASERCRLHLRVKVLRRVVGRARSRVCRRLQTLRVSAA